MRRLVRLLLLSAVGAVAMLVLPAAAGADHATREHENLQALGHSPHAVSFENVPLAQQNINSDIAFWGNLSFNGNYDGFRIIRNSPGNPKEINWTHCNGNQGDIVVWGDILVRAWNSPAPADDPATPAPENRFCDGEPVPVGFEGVHIFDISDVSDPELVGSIELSSRCDDTPNPCRPGIDAFGCGSHTLTAVPDLASDRLLIYNQTSGGNTGAPAACNFVGILEVPFDNPGGARWVRNEPLTEADAGHDTGVILGDANLMATAAHDHANVFDIGDNQFPGGSLEDPNFLYTITEPGVCNDGLGGQPGVDPQRPCNGNWHSASFTWDGEVLILGWEPGGGGQPECDSGDPPVKRTAFFYDAKTGQKVGQWVLPRTQDSDPPQNCTVHNYNTVPTRNGKHILVVSAYQAGTYVVDFTNPANPKTLGFSDPPPLARVTDPATGELIDEVGGAWSSYWYNGIIYESEITKGLNLFRYTGKETRGALRLRHLNPQTQEFTISGKKGDDDGDDDDDRGDDDRGRGDKNHGGNGRKDDDD
jgi:hypothetical protein